MFTLLREETTSCSAKICKSHKISTYNVTCIKGFSAKFSNAESDIYIAKYSIADKGLHQSFQRMLFSLSCFKEVSLCLLACLCLTPSLFYVLIKCKKIQYGLVYSSSFEFCYKQTVFTIEEFRQYSQVRHQKI